MFKKFYKPLLAAAAAAAVAIGVFAAAGNAAADVNRYAIAANSPKPEVCNNHGTIAAGTWLQNKPCGYYVGMAMAGSSFDVQETTGSDYHYGRSHGGNNLCAWIPPGALSSEPTGTAPASCGADVRDSLLHRRAFGYDFNAPAHDATDGSAITVNTGCQAHYNYYDSSSFDSGSLRDAAGSPQAEVAYRFTANGGNAIVVRDSALGWVFLERSCVTDWRGITFHNDDD
ncbi:MAG: hypothetical protein ACRDXX_11080 [Stackebrandtia sp.]